MECDEKIKTMIMEKHDIEKIWTAIIKLKKKLDIVDQKNIFNPINDLQKAKAVIKEFALADRNSIAFRYPTNKKGNSSLPSDMGYIDVNNFVKVMDEVANILEGIDHVIVITQQHRNEFLSEFSGYY